MIRKHILALAAVAALGGVAGIAYAGDTLDADAMAKLMAAKTTLGQAIAIAEKETGGKAIDADFAHEDGAMTAEIEVLKDKSVSKVVIDADSGKVLKVTVAEADKDNGDND
jgi:uncharacterized membrane protein YkoI